jgi:M6 family metalloprotease-like protein
MTTPLHTLRKSKNFTNMITANRKLVAFLSVLTLLFSGSVVVANAAVKQGAKCTKVGKIQTVKGKTFTCLKSGNKLSWVRNTVGSNTTVPSIVDLSKSSTITPIADLSPIEVCKTIDLTSRSVGTNGFPRPANVANGKSEIKILVLPIIFEEIPFTDADLANLQKALKETSDFYARSSFNRVKLTFEIPAKNLWVRLKTTAKDYGILPNKPQQNNEIIVKDTFLLADKEIDFSKYDSVVIESGSNPLTSVGQGFGGQVFSTKTGNVIGATLEIGLAAGQAHIIAHELGHSLYGLEDLYVFLNSQRPSVPEPKPAGRWDVMSDSSGLDDFFAWNKLLMGWVKDEEVRCLQNQSATTHYLAGRTSSVGPKLLLINLAPGVTLAMESRTYYSKNQGLLIYKIDTNINHGDGPITAEKNTLDKGQKKTFGNWTIEVKDSTTTGLLVSVVKQGP